MRAAVESEIFARIQIGDQTDITNILAPIISSESIATPPIALAWRHEEIEGNGSPMHRCDIASCRTAST
jgi:hypothetical protein